MESPSEETSVSRKRHHSRSRSRSKSPSTKNEQEIKRKKLDTEILENNATTDNISVTENETSEINHCMKNNSNAEENTEVSTNKTTKQDEVESSEIKSQSCSKRIESDLLNCSNNNKQNEENGVTQSKTSGTEQCTKKDSLAVTDETSKEDIETLDKEEKMGSSVELEVQNTKMKTEENIGNGVTQSETSRTEQCNKKYSLAAEDKIKVSDETSKEDVITLDKEEKVGEIKSAEELELQNTKTKKEENIGNGVTQSETSGTEQCTKKENSAAEDKMEVSDETCKEDVTTIDKEEKVEEIKSAEELELQNTKTKKEENIGNGSQESLNDTKKENSEKSEQSNDSESKTEDKISTADLDSENEDDEDEKQNESTLSSDTDESANSKEKGVGIIGTNTPTRKIAQDTPSKKLTPKQLQIKLEKEKRKQERQKEKEDRLKKKLEEQLKKKEIKNKELEQKQKEKEMKKKEKDKELEQKQKEKEMRKKEKEEREEKKRKEKEEKEQKRKEKEEKEEQKRKEREEEKQREEEKKQKAAAAFVNFFVPKKPEESQDDKRTQISNFLQFEVKSDMKLPLPRRDFLTEKQKETLDSFLENQDNKASYLKDLSSGKPIGKSLKTWPFEEVVEDDDVILVDLGETISEDKSSLQRYKAKFLYFHDNRRPAYYGTWRKKSKFIKPRKPLAEDSIFNYEEDSDDDWEEEEQGESLNGSEDENEKETEEEKDDYEVDNEFFVPHGHLSEDEVDDEEMTRLSPDSLKQKLKLLKEEFDQDMQSKTHKLKPRSIGCIWYNKDGSNVEDAVDKYLQPLAIISRCQIVIKNRIDIFVVKERKPKVHKEMDPELISMFLKIVDGSSHKKNVLVEQFLSNVEKSGSLKNVSKGMLIRTLRKCANCEKYKDKETKTYKFRWHVHQDLRDKYNLAVEVGSK